MTMYRLKPGAKYGDLKPGDEIELSEAGAKALENKFEPIVLTPEDQETIAGEVHAELAKDAEAAKPEDWDDLLDGSVGSVNIKVEKMTSADKLRSLGAAEKEGKKRIGVLKAVEKRLGELEQG